MSDPKPPPKVQHETVLDAHKDGAPHVTLDQGGALHHYASGCPRIRPERSHRAGPARVTTEGYRDGWDLIWGPKHGGAPS